MREGSFVRLKAGAPNFWNLDPAKAYVVQDIKYFCSQYFIILRNKQGKCKTFYRELFEEIQAPESSDDPKTTELKKTWLHSEGAISRAAYDELKKLDDDLTRTSPFKKGVSVRFKTGAEVGRYENRVFKIIADPMKRSILRRTVKLSGLYGSFDVDGLEIVQVVNQ